MINRYRGEFHLAKMCKVLGVSRSGYYLWETRPECVSQAVNKQLLDEIIHVYESSRRTYGSRKVVRLRFFAILDVYDTWAASYEYEYCYSYTWNAIEGYHYLMKIGRFLNVMAANSEILNERVKKYGIRGFIAHMNRIISGCLLDAVGLQKAVSEKYQIRLVC